MRSFFTPSRLALALAGFLVIGNQSANAEPVIGLTTDNRLVAFDSEDPATILADVTITGLQADENVLGADFRPKTGELFAVGSTSRIYVINTQTGAATQVGASAFTPALTGTDIAFDFNPTVDRIRLIGDDGQNLRLNPDTGAVAGEDTALNFDDDDDDLTPNVAYTGTVTGVAYLNNFDGAEGTTLFGIDNANRRLVTIGGEFSTPSPNLGEIFTVGTLPASSTGNLGFDFSALSGGALFTVSKDGETTSDIYRLSTGRGLPTAKLGTVGTTAQLRDISATPVDITAPTVTITSPSAATVRQRAGTLNVTGTASDNLVVAKVEYRTVRPKKSTDFQAATGTATWSFTLTGLPRGRTTVEVKATDLHGNETVSSFVVNRQTRKQARKQARKARLAARKAAAHA